MNNLSFSTLWLSCSSLSLNCVQGKFKPSRKNIFYNMQVCTTLITYFEFEQTWLPFWLHMLSLYPFDYACWVCTNTITHFEFVPTWLRILSFIPTWLLNWVCNDLIMYFEFYTNLITCIEFVPTWLRIFCSNFWMSPRLTFGWDRTWDLSSASNVSRSLANTKPMERNNSPLQSETSEVCKNIQPWVFQPV